MQGLLRFLTRSPGSARKNTGGVTVGVLLPDSVYVWACGEKAAGQQEDLAASDELIGCFILLVRLVHAVE